MSTIKVNSIEPASGATVSITGLTLSGLGLISGSSIASSEQGSIALTSNGVAASAIDLGLNTNDSPQFTGINLGHASDTTLTRASAGVLAVEGTNVQLQVAEGAFVDGDKTKLDGIEASADVTDTDNVTAAGALMDSEVDVDIKTLSLPANTTISTFGASLVDDADASAARTTLGLGTAATTAATDYATAAQGTTADNALPKAGGQMTGNITFSGAQTVDGRDLSADGSKLDGIETSADVTDTANVKTALNASLGGAATIGDASDTITIPGNLSVTGTTTELQVANLNVEDKNITVASGSADSAAADGAGLTVDGADATFTYSHSGTQWNMNKKLDLGSNDFHAQDAEIDSLGIGTAASGTTGEIRATGDITAYYSSDERLKENIVPLEGALDKVKALRGVSFTWKELSLADKKSIHSHEGTDIGVIAQDVQAQFPELVNKRGHGYLSVDYQKLSAVLIEAVKELSEKVAILESKI